MYPKILQLLLGRVPTTRKGIIQGYKRYGLTDYVFPAVIEDPSSQVEGLLLSGLTETDLQILDDYEGEEYRKDQGAVRLVQPDPTMAEKNSITQESDTEEVEALVYVWMEEYRHLLDGDGTKRDLKRGILMTIAPWWKNSWTVTEKNQRATFKMYL